MPPAPMAATISYGPSLVPGVSTPGSYMWICHENAKNTTQQNNLIWFRDFVADSEVATHSVRTLEIDAIVQRMARNKAAVILDEHRRDVGGHAQRSSVRRDEHIRRSPQDMI